MVRCLESKVTVIQDLDELNTEEDVTTAVNTAFEISAKTKVFVQRLTQGGRGWVQSP